MTVKDKYEYVEKRASKIRIILRRFDKLKQKGVDKITSAELDKIIALIGRLND